MALKVWLPVIIISVLACGVALPAHYIRERVHKRAAARRAAWKQQQQQQQQQDQLAESKDGKKRPVNTLAAPKGRFTRAWHKFKGVMVPVIDVVEPRLVLALYWVDLISVRGSI